MLAHSLSSLKSKRIYSAFEIAKVFNGQCSQVSPCVALFYLLYYWMCTWECLLRLSLSSQQRELQASTRWLLESDNMYINIIINNMYMNIIINIMYMKIMYLLTFIQLEFKTSTRWLLRSDNLFWNRNSFSSHLSSQKLILKSRKNI